jgi:hypothetical protein
MKGVDMVGANAHTSCSPHRPERKKIYSFERAYIDTAEYNDEGQRGKVEGGCFTALITASAHSLHLSRPSLALPALRHFLRNLTPYKKSCHALDPLELSR